MTSQAWYVDDEEPPDAEADAEAFGWPRDRADMQPIKGISEVRPPV